MKIKTNLTAGMTFDQCKAQRDWWKNQASMMENYYYNKSVVPPAGLWFPCQGNPPFPGGGGSGSGSKPPTPSGGYVNGVWVSDMSGYCV
jgi:hypothetical protein